MSGHSGHSSTFRRREYETYQGPCSKLEGFSKIKGLRKIKQHNGSVSTIQLRVVCRIRCNSGWMSALETRAKPILIPLMLGQPLVMSSDDQRILARWFALKVMVAEFSEREIIATPQSERDHLRLQRWTAAQLANLDRTQTRL